MTFNKQVLRWRYDGMKRSMMEMKHEFMRDIPRRRSRRAGKAVKYVGGSVSIQSIEGSIALLVTQIHSSKTLTPFIAYNDEAQAKVCTC